VETYKLISKGTIWFGYTEFSRQMRAKTVASADAFYFIEPPRPKAQTSDQSSFGLAGAMVGGALGGLLGAMLDAAAASKDRKNAQLPKGIEEMKLSQLPGEITGHPDWPIAEKKGVVTIIHRRAVKRLRYSFSWFWLRSRFLLKTGLGEMMIFPPFFQGRKMVNFLKAVGWEL
jgi:hypothetical protein